MMQALASVIGAGWAGVAAVAAAGLLMVGCASPKGESSAPAGRAALVVSPAEFAQLKPGPGVIVLDARSMEDYVAGHLAGARPAPAGKWNDWAREGNGLNDTAAWSARLSELGITREARVVVYDAHSMTDAARVWFILQHFGVANAGVLDGGLKNVHLPAERIASGAAPAITPSGFRAGAAGGVQLAQKDDVKKTAQSRDRIILDARSADEYSGVKKLSNPRGGHMPGAVNVPHTAFYNEQGGLKPAGEIGRILAKAGMKPGDAITVHCQGGGRSSFVALAAAYAGYTNVANYHNSFGEWAADAACPIEQ